MSIPAKGLKIKTHHLLIIMFILMSSLLIAHERFNYNQNKFGAFLKLNEHAAGAFKCAEIDASSELLNISKEEKASLVSTVGSFNEQIQNKLKTNKYAFLNDKNLQLLLNERKKSLKKLIIADANTASQVILPQYLRTLLKDTNCVFSKYRTEGISQVFNIDNFEENISQDEYYLITRQMDRIRLYFFPEKPARLQGSNQRMEIEGLILDKEMLLEVVEIAKSNLNLGTIYVEPAPEDAILGEKKINVIPVYFQNSMKPTLTEEDIKVAVFENANKYYQQNSYFNMMLAGDVQNWQQIPIDNTCDEQKVYQEVLKKFDQTDFSRYQYHMVIAPFINCGWSGKGELSGSWTFISSVYMLDSSDWGTIAHEFGHNIGLHHAVFYDCDYNSGDIDPDCYREYGDIFDVMGYSGYKMQFNAIHKSFLKWIGSNNEKHKIQNVVLSGAYSINPLETAQPGIKALKINDRNSSRYIMLEYRQFPGKELGEELRGILVHSPINDDDRISLLFNYFGEIPLAYTSVLREGQIFNDPITGATIEVAELSDESANLNITHPMPE